MWTKNRIRFRAQSSPIRISLLFVYTFLHSLYICLFGRLNRRYRYPCLTTSERLHRTLHVWSRPSPLGLLYYVGILDIDQEPAGFRHEENSQSGVSVLQERASFHRACYRRQEIRRHGIARIRLDGDEPGKSYTARVRVYEYIPTCRSFSWPLDLALVRTHACVVLGGPCVCKLAFIQLFGMRVPVNKSLENARPTEKIGELPNSDTSEALVWKVYFSKTNIVHAIRNCEELFAVGRFANVFATCIW